MKTAIDGYKVRRIVAAYKLRLVAEAERIGAPAETWGRGHTISETEEKKYLTAQDKYRTAPYPYPGLRSFNPQEGKLFFGREKNVEALRAILADRRVLVVLGGSGSGKSSLVRAGLLPFLNTERRIEGRDGNWYSVEFRPRTDPLGELSKALVNQVLLPLLKLGRKGLAEAMGLPADAGVNESTVDALHKQMLQRFMEAKREGRRRVLETLLYIVDQQLDTCDDRATQGKRLAEPNLFLLIDQLEEVFRPEIDKGEREAVLNLIVDLHAHMRSKEASRRGGLFLAATIRSEEVHRCAEHRGLSDVVIGSGYQIELLDVENKEDAKDLREAIVSPAQNVFKDWGLRDHLDHDDAPFAKGVPDLLLNGVRLLSKELDHRPDQLPLLQHALQSIWHSAIRRWSHPDFAAERLEITRDDLPGQKKGWTEPDLGACLKERADKAEHRAAERFRAIIGTDNEAASADALQAAFRALARRDDRGNWARRFAGRDEIQAFLKASPDSAVAKFPEEKCWNALKQALNVFLLRGYMSRGGDGKYDISHEALIRNWPLFREWLRDPAEVAYALGRVLQEVEPEKFKTESADKQMSLIPEDVAQKVANVADGGKLPTRWGEDQIMPYLQRSELRQRWGSEKGAALTLLTSLAAISEERRKEADAAILAAQKKAAEENAKRETRNSFAMILAGMAALVLIVVGVGYLQIQHAQTDAAETRRKAAEAASQASEAASVAATKLAEARQELVKQMGGNTLVGSMLVAQQKWQNGTRERLALQALAMMFDNAGKEPDKDDLREFTMARWDAGVRAMLGQQYRVTPLKPPVSGDEKLSCLTVGTPEVGGSVALLGSTTEMRIVTPSVPQNDLRFETKEDGQDWRAANNDQSIPAATSLTVGSRLCLAPDGSALTISPPDSALPFIYELNWRTCPEKSDCSWRVGWREIRAGTVPQAFSFQSRFACVNSVRVQPPSEDDDKTVHVNVDFTAEKVANCEPHNVGLGVFRASYVPGTFAAVYNKPDPKLKFSPCEEKNDGLHCALKLPPHRKFQPELVLRRDKSRDDNWSMWIEPVTEGYALNGALLVASKVTGAALDDRGNIWVSDGNKHFWELINDRAILKQALWDRAADVLETKDSAGNRVDWWTSVPEAGMTMTEPERTQGPPPRKPR